MRLWFKYVKGHCCENATKFTVPKLPRGTPMRLKNRVLAVGKKFRLLMQSCGFFCYFFSRPFHENFKFLKNCSYDFHEILHSHSTPIGAPVCAKTSKSYGWDVRNIAKISPKMAKKQPFFDFFSLFSKTVHTIRTKLSTVILHHIRVLYVQWH